MSHPTMGAWIEIALISVALTLAMSRTPRWVRGLKSEQVKHFIKMFRSHPTMGAWIEIALISFALTLAMIVAPHDGCVD